MKTNNKFLQKTCNSLARLKEILMPAQFKITFTVYTNNTTQPLINVTKK